MNAYKINFLFVPAAGGRGSKGSVSVMAKSMEAAREAFYTTHTTAAGQHAIVQVEALAAGKLF